LLSQISAIGGKIEAGNITTTSNISAGDHVLTLQLKSTIEHKDQDNTTYDLGYAITLKIHMHKYNGSTVPVGVSATDVKNIIIILILFLRRLKIQLSLHLALKTTGQHYSRPF
jgi:hypothetical protein